jgi:hypothetical protein
MLISAISAHRQTGADGHAVDRRYDGLLTRQHVEDDVTRLLQGIRHLVGIANGLADPGQVASRGKRPIAGAGHHNHADFGIVVHHVPDLGQLPMHTPIGRVHRLCTIESEQQHPIGFLIELEKLKIGVLHDRSPFLRLRGISMMIAIANCDDRRLGAAKNGFFLGEERRDSGFEIVRPVAFEERPPFLVELIVERPFVRGPHEVLDPAVGEGRACRQLALKSGWSIQKRWRSSWKEGDRPV